MAANEHPSVTFLRSLYQYCNEGFINLRFLPSAKNYFTPLSEIDSIPGILENHKRENAHFSVATRVEGDGTKAGILQIPDLWVDIDLGKLPEEKKNEIRQRYKDFFLKPSFLIDSGGGIHSYWKLKEPAIPEDIPRLERILKRLADYFGADMAATDASRRLRIPGTLNHKYNPPRKVTLKVFTPVREYDLADFNFLTEMETQLQSENPHEPEDDRLARILECDFLKHCDKDRVTLSEPEWYGMVSILAREPGGRDLIPLGLRVIEQKNLCLNRSNQIGLGKSKGKF